MSKYEQAGFKRDKVSEKAFKQRYGKDVTVLRAITKCQSGKVDRTSIHIIPPDGEKYVITTVYDKNQIPIQILSGKEKEKHQYNSYLEAEVYVVDKIAEKEKKENKNG